MQKPVLCTPLLRHLLPTASIKTLSTPMQNCWCTGWHWRKNSFWIIASLSKKTANMLLKSDFICLNSVGWQKNDCSTGITVALFLGHNHKFSFGFVSGHLSSGGHKFFSNLLQIFGSYVIMYYMMCIECCNHHQIYVFLTTDSTHIFHIFTSMTS